MDDGILSWGLTYSHGTEGGEHSWNSGMRKEWRPVGGRTAGQQEGGQASRCVLYGEERKQGKYCQSPVTGWSQRSRGEMGPGDVYLYLVN